MRKDEALTVVKMLEYLPAQQIEFAANLMKGRSIDDWRMFLRVLDHGDKLDLASALILVTTESLNENLKGGSNGEARSQIQDSRSL